MAGKTEALFRDDAYQRAAEAEVVAINDRGGILLDRTIFYATSGGQPGDTGIFERADGSRMAIAATITGETKDEIIHVPAPEQPMPAVGEKLKLLIDWERRHLLMRMHSACHLLTVVCPFPITGAAVAEDDSRVDFDIPDAGFSKEDVTARLMELVRADHPIFTRLITDEELAANPGLVKSKNVRPPVGTGKIRLVCIGDNGWIDSQPCGGTHVKSTGEVGEIHIGKIEKKGRENRRFRIRFGPMPAN
ncbi:alanyl-tRNA editing protein [Mesorhizobium sp. M2D.F.Ca.ET.185.01.1.1]|uniref:alanyl-tRNA editing protein n=1 Tax=unclassified Mesorhizobium TaxID=325217 RepID=UPI000FCC23DC|nr:MULTISPECIES: alanyl-tRNA editing protein [unclassified Mesorhizobium]TGP52622.1 alanyl-tRNA editing protein [bacterium M00.F.Ca.ET.230.01.1.1]TGP72908.1 alanyl-tRNA editing protein [bacterium M00.F.Ca.ET.227.01.1.1]TGP86595.1 alanyl-tRNA editing protein [bacterium M00.F.Ca.ET.221.01.1.1]TGP87691.1 alanyl-tRNA editing protein [bacterium M00.F.Ca.ET.222.01.1.1]TGT73281.1 alanyl-tRNA editing protein [bacterium M00.F.Ca.ET.159.01.1.1]TGT84412.1 alanyl-tRNA editing protein [bacterium M00.F.Ca.